MSFTDRNIFELLHRLGVTANYTGFYHTAFAVRLCAEKMERLQMITKWVYPDVARQYGTSWTAVERNIRTVSKVIWRENRPLLEALARKPLTHQPGTAQLLAILAYSLRTQQLDLPPTPETQKAEPFPGDGFSKRGTEMWMDTSDPSALSDHSPSIDG